MWVAIAHVREEIRRANLASLKSKLQSIDRGRGMAATQRHAGHERRRERQCVEPQILDRMSCRVAAGNQDAARAGREHQLAQQVSQRRAKTFAMLPVRGLRSQCGVQHDTTAVVERVESFFHRAGPGRWSIERPRGETHFASATDLIRSGGRAASTEDQKAVDWRSVRQLSRGADEPERSPVAQ